MIRAYKYRIYPTQAQVRKLEGVLDICCELYNAALQERRDAWRVARKSVSYYDQQNQLPELKRVREDLKSVHSQVLRDPLMRLDRAFNNFFRRIKAGEKPGFPRFRSRYNSFTFSQEGFAIRSNKLKLSKIGMLKIKLHRPIDGKIKTLTVKRSLTGKWFACFSVECEPQALPQSLNAVGVDMGLKSFAVLSTSEAIDNPRFFRVEEKRLIKAQKRLSKASKGSPEREKRRKVVARVNERVANKRRDFAHQISRKLVNRFGIIVFENLNIQGMGKSRRFAKSITDAGWAQFIAYTSYKAENAGRRVAQVNPHNTSQKCSRCGGIVEKDLSVRIHSCSSCGLTLDRDHNAAINILALGLQSIGRPTIEAAPVQGAE